MVEKTLIALSIILLLISSGCIGTESSDISNGTSTKVVPAKKLTTKVPNNGNDTSIDAGIPSTISYLQSKNGPNWINWTWDNPEDEDFSHVMIFIDGKFKTNVTKPNSYYNLTRLASEKQYTISTLSVDLSKNINPSWVNGSTSTQAKYKDKIPPDKIWYLEPRADRTWINWTWENPWDKDYSYANVYINDKFKVNITKPKSYYNLTGLAPDTEYTISIRTVDSNRNINLIWVSNIARTLP